MVQVRARQQEFAFECPWGGKREGAGRRPVGERAGQSHAVRESFDGDRPLHVTMHLEAGLPGLREKGAMSVFGGVMQECCDWVGEGGEFFRVVEWSVQPNHVHMICEASDARALGRAMRRISIRLAKRWNQLWGRKGRVFSDRYHVEVLGALAQIRNTLVYVLQMRGGMR
jgi:putative transposase